MFHSPKPDPNPVTALIIGVDRYRDYDPSGSADLPGASTDAEGWSLWCRDSLRLGSDQVRVLRGAAASRAAMVEGLQWVGRRVARSPDQAALITFSGHGLTLGPSTELSEGTTLALAPADITPDLHEALSFVEIEAVLAKAIGLELFGGLPRDAEQREAVQRMLGNITTVLDCCYTSTARAGTRALPNVPGVVGAQVQVFARQLLACQLWESASEVRVRGRWHGAFTWSLLTMLEQWRVGTDADTSVDYVRAAYGELVFRARELVQTLGLPEQKPTLLGDVRNLPLLPFLRPGSALEEGWTSPDPDGVRRNEEFSSGLDTQFILTFFAVGSVGKQATSNMIARYSRQGSQGTWTFYPTRIHQSCGEHDPPGWSYAIDSPIEPPAERSQVCAFEDAPTWMPEPSAVAMGNQPGGAWLSAPKNSDASTAWAIQFQWLKQSGTVQRVRTWMAASQPPTTSDTVSLTGSQGMADMQSAIGGSAAWYYTTTDVS